VFAGFGKTDLSYNKDWLERIKGIKLGLEDSIFIELHPPYQAISLSSLAKISVTLGKRSGVPFGWHDARSYVETALEEIKIHPNWARKIRGRKVRGEESPYSRPATEQLRKAFKEAVPLLEFTQPTTLMDMQKRQEIVEELTAKLVSGTPFTEEDKRNIKSYGIRMFERRKSAKSDCPDGEHCGESDFRQINESELLRHLKEGWQIVHRLANGDVIIKR
jgi:hypothetical protein